MSDEKQREADALRTRELVAEASRFRALAAYALAELERTHADAYALTQEQTARLRDASTREREMPLRSMAAELAVDARVSDRTLQTQLFEAHRTMTEFQASWEAWREGRVSRAHVRVIVDAGADLSDDEARAAYEAEVLAYAEKTSAGRVRSFAEQVVEKHNPKTMQERHDVAVLDRRVWVEDLRDGMSMLGVIGPSVEVRGVHDRLTRQGKAIKAADRAVRREAAARAAADTAAAAGRDAKQPDPPQGDGEIAATDVGVSFGLAEPGESCAAGGSDATENLWFDERTLDQIRTDVLLDMMLTSSPSVEPTGGGVEGGLGAIRAHVQVTVPATTLAGTTTGGAELDGKCAVDPETAKILAGNVPSFDRVFLDPVTGAVLAVDRRFVTAEQKRYLVARDIRCRFPGCRRPARDCDWDHREDWALGGKTDVDNVGAFCRRHHAMKQAAGWTVVQEPGGRLRFTAPSGLKYTDDPPPRVVFMPDPPPAQDPADEVVAPF